MYIYKDRWREHGGGGRGGGWEEEREIEGGGGRGEEREMVGGGGAQCNVGTTKTRNEEFSVCVVIEVHVPELGYS